MSRLYRRGRDLSRPLDEIKDITVDRTYLGGEQVYP